MCEPGGTAVWRSFFSVARSLAAVARILDAVSHCCRRVASLSPMFVSVINHAYIKSNTCSYMYLCVVTKLMMRHVGIVSVCVCVCVCVLVLLAVY